MNPEHYEFIGEHISSSETLKDLAEHFNKAFPESQKTEEEMAATLVIYFLFA